MKKLIFILLLTLCIGCHTRRSRPYHQVESVSTQEKQSKPEKQPEPEKQPAPKISKFVTEKYITFSGKYYFILLSSDGCSDVESVSNLGDFAKIKLNSSYESDRWKE